MTKTIKEKDYNKLITKFINEKILYGEKMGSLQSLQLISKAIRESGLPKEKIYQILVEKKDELLELLADTKYESPFSAITFIFSCIVGFDTNPVFSGCYMIRNKDNNSIYVGESINLFRRFINHVSDLYNNTHHCKALQDDFNLTKDISNFTFVPLKCIPIVNLDKYTQKSETLYLESAYYLFFKEKGINLYNTIDPYEALKRNNVQYLKEPFDTSEALNKLYYDKYKILSDELKKKIKLEIKEIITPKKEIKYPFSDNIIESPKTAKKTIKIKNQDFELPQKIKEHINYTNSIKDKKSLYRITHVLNEFANDGLLDLNYCYVTVRKALCEENFLSLTSHNKMAPTENSLQKKYLLIGNVRTELDGEIYCSPIYVTNEGKEEIKRIILKYKDDGYDFTYDPNTKEKTA